MVIQNNSMPKLQSFTINNYSKLINLTSNDFSSLKTLDLSSNDIRTIQDNIFS